MDAKFTIEYERNVYTIVKVFENTDYYLYVLPNDSSSHGFFMKQNKENNRWELYNRVLVAKEIQDIEEELALLLERRLKAG